MPNLRKGRIIYHKVGGEWVIKQRCKSIASAKRAKRLLDGLAHGMVKKKEKR